MAFRQPALLSTIVAESPFDRRMLSYLGATAFGTGASSNQLLPFCWAMAASMLHI